MIANLDTASARAQIREQPAPELNFFCALMAGFFIGGSVIITCGVMLSQSVQNRHDIELQKLINQQTLTLESKCLEVK